MFPNPAHGTVHIRYNQGYLITKYAVFSLSGQLITEQNVTGGGSDIPVNISSLKPGYYELRVVCIRNSEIVYPVFKLLIY